MGQKHTCQYPVQSLQEAKLKLLTFKQGPHMTPSEYYKWYKHLGTNIGEQPARIKEELKTLAKDPDKLTNNEHKRAT